MSHSAQPATLPVAVTMGDPAGIGAEISLKAYAAFRANPEAGKISFFLIDDPVRLEKLAREMSANITVATISSPTEAAAAFSSALPVLPLTTELAELTKQTQFGKPSPNYAPAVIHAIEKGVRLCLKNDCAALVTNPISKDVLLKHGFQHPGHTEFLGELTKDVALLDGMKRGPVMMLSSPMLKVAPATVHLPLKDVPGALTLERVVETASIVGQSLQLDFGIPAPRLAICGLNPHAGENGQLGTEELEIIGPAIQQLRQAGWNAFGPIPADSMFHDTARTAYDAAIAMYHDQGLVPIKTIAFHEAVNVTLGLPIIRTSPDHGTGFDIAGKGIARPDSLVQAIATAAMIARTRPELAQIQ